MNAIATYTLADLVNDVQYVEHCFRVANEHGDEARKPENRLMGHAARGTVAAHHVIAASQLQDEACDRQEKVNEHPAAARIRTYCAVLGEDFGSKIIRRLFAVAALHSGRTLDDVLVLDLEEATALLPMPDQLRLPKA